MTLGVGGFRFWGRFKRWVPKLEFYISVLSGKTSAALAGIFMAIGVSYLNTAVSLIKTSLMCEFFAKIVFTNYRPAYEISK